MLSTRQWGMTIKPNRVDYSQFRLDADRDVLYWTPDDEREIHIPALKGEFQFRALSTLLRVRQSLRQRCH